MLLHWHWQKLFIHSIKLKGTNQFADLPKFAENVIDGLDTSIDNGPHYDIW